MEGSSSQEMTVFSSNADSPSANPATKVAHFLSADIPLGDIPEKEPETEKTDGRNC